MHADHVTGLPGILMLSSQVDRVEPLYIYGPKKLKEYIDSSRKILDMYINYEIIFVEVNEGIIIDNDEYSITAIKLNHTKPCFGYVMREKDRPGEFFPQKAIEYKIKPGPDFGKIQRGETVINTDGVSITSQMVMGESRRGRSFGYITDTLYMPSIAEAVKEVDLLLCEGMFESGMEEVAKDKKHMCVTQAAQIAKDANVKYLALMHYSPRYNDFELKALKYQAREIFENTILTRDRMIFSIPNDGAQLEITKERRKYYSIERVPVIPKV